MNELFIASELLEERGSGVVLRKFMTDQSDLIRVGTPRTSLRMLLHGECRVEALAADLDQLLARLFLRCQSGAGLVLTATRTRAILGLKRGYCKFGLQEYCRLL